MASQRPKPQGSDIKQSRKLTMADGLMTAKSGRCRTRLPPCSHNRKPTRASTSLLTLHILADTTVVWTGNKIIRKSAGCGELQLKSATYPKILQKIGRYHLVMYLLVARLDLVIMQLLPSKNIIYLPSSPGSALSAFPRFPPLPFLLPPHPDSTSAWLDSLRLSALNCDGGNSAPSGM